MKFQQIRSATALVTFAQVRFLIDPWFADKDSVPPIPGSPNPGLRCPIHELPLPVEELLKTDAVIATHLHFDHFDEKAMEVLPRDMPIFTQDDTDRKTLMEKGFAHVKILSPSGTQFKGVTLFKTECCHGIPGRMEELYERMHLRKEACGIIFKHPDETKTFYLSGDTIWYEGVARAIATYHPDVIAVNAAEATIKGYGKIIMGLEDIEQVMKAAPDAVLIATHMDNVGHECLWRKDLHRYAQQNHLENRLLIPEDGETCIF